MSRFNKLFPSLLFLMAVTKVGVLAQSTPPVSATGHILAEVISVFSASETSQMNFGRFSPGPQGGQLILTPESTISVLGSVFSGAGNHNAASFYVAGDVDAAYSITLPTNPVVLTHSSNDKTMLVADWVSVPSSGMGAGMLLNGYQVAYVGATIIVGTINDNPVGIYTGSYTITFDFN